MIYYNADGRKVKSVVNELTGAEVTKYYYAGSQRIAMRKNGTLTFILGDHLGSTSLVTDASGVVINQTQYKAWGETRYSSGTEQTKYQYTGQYSYANDFGLMFYNARWYDPSLGRFAQADTIVPSGVQGLDRYAYVNNSPLNYVDPSGHDPWWCETDSCISGWMKTNSGNNIINSQIKIGFGTIIGYNERTDEPILSGFAGGSTLINNQHTIVTATHVLPGGEDARVNEVSYEFDVPYMFVFDNNGNVHIYSTDGIEVQYADDVALLVLPFDLSSELEYEPASLSDDLDIIYEAGTILIAAYIDGDPRQANNQGVLEVSSLGGPFANRAWITNPNGTINGGDSGGGVFHNGELVGVLSQGNGSPIVQVRGFGITAWDDLFNVQAR